MISSHLRLAPVIIFLASYALHGQAGLTIAPNNLSFRMVAQGVIPDAVVINVSGPTGAKWTASLTPDPGSDPPWLVLNGGNGPVTGVVPGSFKVELRGWMTGTKAAGVYHETVAITPESGAAVKLPATWTIVPRSPGPIFRYISGPTGCKTTRDFPDADTCTVPDEWPNPMPPPAKGTSYRDPNFGATVRVLSDDCAHAYSTPSAVSANNTYALLYCNNGPHVIDIKTTRDVYMPPGGHNSSARWDARNDSVYYYMRGATIQKVDVAAKNVSTLIDYSKGERRFKSIQSGGTGDNSKDNWMPFWAPDEKQICALDIDHVRTYCADYTKIPGQPVGGVDYTMIAKGIDRPTGKRYVLLLATPTAAIFSVNQAANRLDFEYRGPENPQKRGNHDGVCDPGEVCLSDPHTDTLEDSAGIQYLVMNGETYAPCEIGLATYRLNAGPKIMTDVELGGGRKRVMAIDKCSGPPWPKDDHIGCAKNAPYCVISITYNVVKNPADKAPIARAPHSSEVFLMKDNGAEILRLAQVRSMRFTSEGDGGYWTEPRACISDDASLVVFDSNFFQPGKWRAVSVETGIHKAR